LKQLLITVVILGSTFFTFGQTIEDKQAVIQMSIDLDELQNYYHDNEEEDRKPLFICDNGIVPSTLELSKFGEPVHFMPKKDLFFTNKQAFLDFEKFQISETSAAVDFQYKVEGIAIELTFEKTNGSWIIDTKKLTEK